MPSPRPAPRLLRSLSKITSPGVQVLSGPSCPGGVGMGGLHSSPSSGLVGTYRRDCSPPLTLYEPPSPSLKPSAPHSLRRRRGPRTIDPKPGPQRPLLSPQRKTKGVFTPGNFPRLFLLQVFFWEGHCQLLLAPGGGHVRFMGCPWALGPSWPGSPLMELICDLLISPEQIRL